MKEFIEIISELHVGAMMILALQVCCMFVLFHYLPCQKIRKSLIITPPHLPTDKFNKRKAGICSALSPIYPYNCLATMQK